MEPKCEAREKISSLNDQILKKIAYIQNLLVHELDNKYFQYFEIDFSLLFSLSMCNRVGATPNPLNANHTLQSFMNAKFSQQKVLPCKENGLVIIIPATVKIICQFQVHKLF